METGLRSFVFYQTHLASPVSKVRSAQVTLAICAQSMRLPLRGESMLDQMSFAVVSLLVVARSLVTTGVSDDSSEFQRTCC